MSRESEGESPRERKATIREGTISARRNIINAHVFCLTLLMHAGKASPSSRVPRKCSLGCNEDPSLHQDHDFSGLPTLVLVTLADVGLHPAKAVELVVVVSVVFRSVDLDCCRCRCGSRCLWLWGGGVCSSRCLQVRCSTQSLLMHLL